MKKKIIISGSVIILIILVFFAYRFMQQNKIEREAKAQDEQAKKEQLQEKQNYDNYQQQMAALYEKSVEDCKLIKQLNEANKCVNGIAVELRKKDYCDKIVDDEKLIKDCKDEIDYVTLSWGDDPNKCINLNTDNYREQCYTEYFSKLDETKDCDIVSDQKRKDECLDIVNNRLALVFDKPEACKDIKDGQKRSDCQKNVQAEPLDSDKDGLSDDVEISFGTDPFKADTDGDSVSDYDEINRDHTNPLAAN